jgi:hypothetical protein
MACFFKLEHLNNRVILLAPDAPNTIPSDCGFDNCSVLARLGCQKGGNMQSSNAEVKFIHMFPSHVPLPLLLTVLGIDAVSISSILFKNPSGVRNPTMIFGTPRRNDCIQNFISFLSKVTKSLSFRISAVVLSSTQFIGETSEGL